MRARASELTLLPRLGISVHGSNPGSPPAGLQVSVVYYDPPARRYLRFLTLEPLRLSTARLAQGTPWQNASPPRPAPSSSGQPLREKLCELKELEGREEQDRAELDTAGAFRRSIELVSIARIRPAPAGRISDAQYGPNRRSTGCRRASTHSARRRTRPRTAVRRQRTGTHTFAQKGGCRRPTIEQSPSSGGHASCGRR